MSQPQALDSELFKALVSELRKAAYDLREVDGFVEFRPDLRRIETEREARRVIRDIDEALKYAAEMELEIPGWRFTAVPPGSVYWMDWIFPNGAQEPGIEALWEFALFGPPNCNLNDKALRNFDLVASEATKLILHDRGRGDSAQTSWLIHLADRGDESTKGDHRRYLKWQERGTVLRRPLWSRLPSAWDSTSQWWAARLNNVFGLSLLAVEQAVGAPRESAGAAASPASAGPSGGTPTTSAAVVGDEGEMPNAPAGKPDGPEAGSRVWHKGTSVEASGRNYAVIAFMWGREWASFDGLKEAVNAEAGDDTVHTWAYRANGILAPLSLPWKLAADGVNRVVRKQPR